MISALELLTSFLTTLISDELGKLEEALLKAAPEALKDILGKVLALDSVQAKIKEWEEAGVSGAVHAMKHGWEELVALVMPHVNEQVRQLVAKAAEELTADGLLPALHLTPDQVRALATKSAAQINSLLGLP